jgi:3-carboxy-cis,cis-muconate cycloisomerase
MPQKRNPVDATLARAAARLALAQVPLILQAMDQEHERAAGAWQAEWAALPALFCATGCAVSRVRSAVEGLAINAAQMRVNLDQGGGLLMAEALTMALAPHAGRPEAQRLVAAACTRALDAGTTLSDAARADPAIRALLAPGAIAHALDPEQYLGSADALIDRALAAWQSEREGM